MYDVKLVISTNTGAQSTVGNYHQQSTPMEFILYFAIDNKTLPQSDYCPLLHYDTCFILSDYNIQTYNQLSLDHHGSYKLLVHDVYPIAKILYSFSL